MKEASYHVGFCYSWHFAKRMMGMGDMRVCWAFTDVFMRTLEMERELVLFGTALCSWFINFNWHLVMLVNKLCNILYSMWLNISHLYTCLVVSVGLSALNGYWILIIHSRFPFYLFAVIRPKPKPNHFCVHIVSIAICIPFKAGIIPCPVECRFPPSDDPFYN